MSAGRAHLVDGTWRPGGGPEFASRDPATGEQVWVGREADAATVAAACHAARRALPDWEARGVEARGKTLRGFARALAHRSDAMAEAICREAGKPRWEALGEIRSMISKVDISIRAHARRCEEIRAGASITRYRPHGVVAVFGPFNFPGHLPNGHIVPALLAGNTIVFKPSERTPGVAALTATIWLEAGLPPGVLNVVQGGHATGQALAAEPGLDGIFFTGSAQGGLWLHRQFSGRPERILALEMGGNNPLVAWSVRQVDAAVVAAVQSAFLSAGQRCTCARRLILPAGAEGDRLLGRLVEVTRQLRVGAWSDESEPFMGPVIGPEVAARLLAAQESLVTRGAQPILPLRHLRAGTGRVSPGLIDVTDARDREDEELFGPLLQVIRVRAFEDALKESRATRFGLAAGLLSDDPALWERFRRDARAGIVNWNQQLTGASSAAPFGGLGLSGNHRPGAWLAADYCSHPVAGFEVDEIALPKELPPGLAIPGRHE